MTQKKLIKTLIPFIIVTIISFLLFYSDLDVKGFTIIILAILAFIAAFIDSKETLFSSLGFKKKNVNLKNLVIYAPLTGFAILLLYLYILTPIITKFTGVPIDISSFDTIRGNTEALIGILFFIWISAAFGEEIVFRGYFMTRFEKFFGNSKIAIVTNIILFAIFFGAIHSYQGITGQILSGITGAIIATVFHFRKNDLWFVIVVHGMIDTLAMIAIYYDIL
jgi:membrane protease YdiL (CAAX protease family)